MSLLRRPMLIFEGPDAFHCGADATWHALPQLGQINSSWYRRVVLEPQKLLSRFFPHSRYITRIADGIPYQTSDDGYCVKSCWINRDVTCKTYRWSSEGRSVIHVKDACIYRKVGIATNNCGQRAANQCALVMITYCQLANSCAPTTFPARLQGILCINK